MSGKYPKRWISGRSLALYKISFSALITWKNYLRTRTMMKMRMRKH